MDRKGFTLIEVLVAMVVLSIALLAVIQMNIMYVKANTYNHQLSAATMIAQEKMEELRGYARSDRADKFSPFDFDFMLSIADTFTTVMDDADVFTVPGLSSGNGEVALPNNGTVYATMDALAGGTAFGASDTINALGASDAFLITRTWAVTPMNIYDQTSPDYAHLLVTASWTDQYGTDRTVRVESTVHRRQ